MALHKVSSNPNHGIVVNKLTRSLCHAPYDQDQSEFILWLSANGGKAVGFAADLKPIASHDGQSQRHFVPLEVSSLGQGKIIRENGSMAAWQGKFGEGITYTRGWPGLWNFCLFDACDISAELRNVVGSLSEISIEGGPADLIRLSHIDPCSEIDQLTRVLLKFWTAAEITHVIPEVAAGSSYPFMFDAIRDYFMSKAQVLRPFRPHIDWGGPQECVTAGAHTYGDPRILYYPPARVIFGRYCSVAEGVTIILANHSMTGATTYPFKLEEYRWPSQLAQSVQDFAAKDVIIGNDVWIGRGVTILCGAEIGDGAIIGADSVVRGKVPPYSLFIGNPGRVVRERYSPEIVDRFLRLRWWDWPDWKVDRHSIRMLADSPLDFLNAAEADNN
ncbi:CatB-related O-acetyltransferase [Methylobacterium mesophilicum]